MQIFRPIRAYWAERRGAAAAEFAIVLMVLVFPLLNVIDFGMYIYQGMELNEAAQAAAEGVLTVCTDPMSPPELPATLFCPQRARAETTAVQSTSLGNAVTITATTENYYCTNTATGALVQVGSFPNNLPKDCSAVGLATDTPGDYILITVSYNYTPMFTGVSLASQLQSPLTRTAWMRLD